MRKAGSKSDREEEGVKCSDGGVGVVVGVEGLSICHSEFAQVNRLTWLPQFEL